MNKKEMRRLNLEKGNKDISRESSHINIGKRIMSFILAMILSLGVINYTPTKLITEVKADDTQNTVPDDENYSTEIHTYNGNENYTAKYGPGFGPYSIADTNGLVQQSNSPTSGTTFAAGLPLGTIFIDQNKIGDGKMPTGDIEWITKDQSYLAGLQYDSATGTVSYKTNTSDAAAAKPLYSNTLNELNGELFALTFKDAAILPDGTRANVKITYSNAKIVVDQRINNLPTKRFDGEIRLAQGSSFSYGVKSDMTFNIAQQTLVDSYIKNNFPNLATNYKKFSNSDVPKPVVGSSMDAKYQVVDSVGVPIHGTFVFAITGINLDRDPGREAQQAQKPLWYVKDFAPDYNFFSEAMSINGGQSSNYVYVRPNNGIKDSDGSNSGAAQSTGGNFYPHVGIDGNGNLRFTSNAYGNNDKYGNNAQAGDNSYASGFVTLADAAEGFRVTGIGYGGGTTVVSGGYNTTMNTKPFSSKQIWYRYTESTGLHGSIATTSEGNYGGKLSDHGNILEPSNKWNKGNNWNGSGTPGAGEAATHVVTEGKDVYYTMTPDIGYKASRIWIGETWNSEGLVSRYKEIQYDNSAVSKMKKGDKVSFTTAAGHDGLLEYNDDGTYTLKFDNAEHDEAVHVEWEPTTADVFAYKIWDDDNDKDGIRYGAEQTNSLPKLKLQWSLNGRTWNEVSSPMNIGSVTYNFPTYGRTVAPETVPAGKDSGGNYKDGSYSMNNDTTGNHPFTWEYLPVYSYDSNGRADKAIQYRLVEVNDPWHSEYHSATYHEQQIFDLLSSKENSTDGWQMYSDGTNTYVLKGDGKYYSIDANSTSEKTPANPQPTGTLTPVSSSDYWTEDKAIEVHEVQAKNTHFTTELYVDVTKVWDDDSLLGLIPTSGINGYQREEIKIVLSGKTKGDGNVVDLNGDANGSDLIKTITTDEGEDKQNVTGTETIDGFPRYRDSLGNEFVKIYNSNQYDNGYYAVFAGGIDYASGPVDNLPNNLTPVKKGDGTYKINDDKYGAMFEDLPTHYNGKEIEYSVKETDIAGNTLNKWILTGGVLSPVKNTDNDVLGYTTTMTNTPDVEEVYTPLPLQILKQDINSKGVLEGAEFTIYTNAITEEKASESNTELVGAKNIYSITDADNVKTRYVFQNGKYYELDSNDTIASTPANPQPSKLDLTKEGLLGGETGYSDGTNKYVLRDNQYHLVDANGNIADTPASPQPDTNLIKETKDLTTGEVEKNVVVTDDSGNANVKFLKSGTYYIKETKAPVGYEADPTIYVFDVDAELKSITLKDASGDHATKWWEKLYDLIFGNDTTKASNWNQSANNKGGTLTVSNTPLVADVLVRKYWNDNDNQDGKRPGDSTNPTATADPLLPTVTLQWTTSAHTAEGLNVYTNGKTGEEEKKYVLKNDNYYEVTKEDVVGKYQDSAATTQPTNVTSTSDTCNGLEVFKDASDKKYVIIDQKYHEVISIDETGTVASSPATEQPDVNQINLVMDDDDDWTTVKVTDGTTTKDATEKVNYVGGPVLTHQNDAYTWTNLPAYRDGKLVTYRIVEEGDILNNESPNYAYDIETNHTSQTHEKTFYLVNTDGANPTRLNQTVDVTNKHETQVINIEVYKTWDDEDENDRKASTIRLYKVINGIETVVTKGTGSNTKEDTGVVPVDGQTDPIKVWNDLPTYENGVPVTYRLKEETVDGYITIYEAIYTDKDDESVKKETNDIKAEDVKRTFYSETDELPDEKKVGDENTKARFDIKNERSVNVKVEKTWVNGANANVTFELWRTITPESSLTSSKLTSTPVADDDNNRYYVNRTTTLTEAEWNTLSDDAEKAEYTRRYKHNTNGNIISAKQYNDIGNDERAKYTQKYVLNGDLSTYITIEEWNALDPSEQENYSLMYVNDSDPSGISVINQEQYDAIGNAEKAEYSPVYVNDNHKIITSETYDALSDSEKEKYEIEATTSWSPYVGGGKDASAYVLISDGTREITKEVYEVLSPADKALYKAKTVDGWELVGTHLFDANVFDTLNTGSKVSYSFDNLLIKDVDGHEYLYRVLEKPSLLRFRENQISNTEVIDNNVNVQDGNVTLEVVKALENRNWRSDDDFYFYLEPVEGVNVTDPDNPVTIAQDEVPMPYRIDAASQKTTYNYTADATYNDQQVGSVGRVAAFQDIQYKENSTEYYSIPRGDTVEFYYKVYEIYDTKTEQDTANNSETITKDTDLDTATNHSGYLDGILYDGNFTYEEKSDGKYILASDDKYYLATDTLPTGVTNKDATKKYAPKFNEDADGKYILGSDGIYYLATDVLPSGVTNANESKKYTPTQFNPTVYEAKVIVKNTDGIISTETKWKQNGEYVNTNPVYTNKYHSVGVAKIWIEKNINNRAWVDYDNEAKTGDAFGFKIESISGAELNVPGSTSEDSYTTKPLMSNTTNNPQKDIQKMSDTEYAFGMNGNRYDNTMLNSSGYAYFIYEISENKAVNYTDENFAINNYTVDGLVYEDQKIYVRLKAQDNFDGTISFEVDYFTDASCKEESRIKNHKAWIHDDGTETNEGKRLLSKTEVEAIKDMTPEQIKAAGYREINVAYFTNYETVDIPVKKEWVDGPAVEDVNLHLERHLFDLSEVNEASITDDFVKAEETRVGVTKFWETAGYTHYAERGDFLNTDGTPKYDEGSTTTSSKVYKDIKDFNLNLPKYEVIGNKTYRIVYRLLEDETSSTYTKAYRSIKNDIITATEYNGKTDEEKADYAQKYVNNNDNSDIITQDAYNSLDAEGQAKYSSKYVKEIVTENDYIYTDGETLVVTNTVIAKNKAKVAAVKQLRDRNWLASDDFKFILTPVGKAVYDSDDKIIRIQPTTEIPMPTGTTGYVNKEDETDVISVDEYNALPAVSKDSYKPVSGAKDDAHAKIDEQVVDPNGNLERLARFGEIEYTVDDLVFNNKDNHMHGDYFYTIKEDIPSDAVAYNKTDGNKISPEITFTEENRDKYVWKGKDGITYDSSVHTVHVSIKENRTKELQVSIAYDEKTNAQGVPDEKTGTQFTPVFTNRYEATAEVAVTVDKYIMGREWKSTDVFDFRMTALGGAPFEDAVRSEFPSEDTHSDIDRDTDLEKGYAIHSQRGAHVKRMSVKGDSTAQDNYSEIYIDETDPENVSIITKEEYEELADKGNYVQKYRNDADNIITPEEYAALVTYDDDVQSMNMPKLLFTLSELNKTVTEEGKLKYSDKSTNVPVGTAYGQFVYSFEETNDYLDKSNKTVKDLSRDEDTEYARITVIDKGDGTLDYYTEIFEDRYCQVPRYVPGSTTELATKPAFVNQLKRELSITKAWAGPASSDVTLKLQWSIDGEHFYNVDEAEWLPSGVRYSQTIARNAFGKELTKTWSNLPAYADIEDRYKQEGDDFDLNDKWVYYQIIEDAIPHTKTRYSTEPYVAGESYDNAEKYKDADNSPHTGPEKDSETGEYVTDRVTQLYVTNWPDDITGEANVGVVKQYIGKEWDKEEFKFEITPVESKIGNETTPVKEGAKRKTGNYVNNEGRVISKAEWDSLVDADKAAYSEEEVTNVMPKYNKTNGNKATAKKDAATTVSVNEHAANFDSLSIKLTDLAVDTTGSSDPTKSDYNPNFGKAVGTFYYKVKEVIPSPAVEVKETIDGVEKTFYVADDANGNKIKYTTDEHIVKIFAIDDGSGTIDTTVSFDDRKTGEFVPVYTNYAMEKTPIEGTKTWIGGTNAEHVNGTVELSEEDTKIVSASDSLELKLQRKLDKETTATTLSKDDAGRILVIVWAKVTDVKENRPTYAYSEDLTTPIVDDAHPVISAQDYEILDPEVKENYIPYGTEEVVTGKKYEKQVGYDSETQTGGDESPYTYTVLAVDGEGNYHQPILNTTDKDGNYYTYSITEGKVPADYEVSYEGLDVTNTKTLLDQLKVTKTWDDESDAEGFRPENVTFHLFKLVDGKLVQVEVVEKELTANEGDTDDNTWDTGIVWDKLPVYGADGKKIKYVVLEESIYGYKTTYKIDGEYVPETIDNEETTWNEISAAEAKADPSGEYYDGENGTVISSEDLEAYEDTASVWTKTTTTSTTPASENDGIVIELDGAKHKASEDEVAEGKASEAGEMIDDEPQVVDVKNELTPATDKVIVTKVWDDNNNNDGKRPTSVTFTLYERVWNEETKAYGAENEATLADGTTKVDKLVLNGEKDTLTDNKPDVREIEPVDSNTWKGEFTNLPETKNGKKVIYYVKEDTSGSEYAASGTKAKYSDEPIITGNQLDGYEVKNIYTPDTVDASITKVWADNSNSLNTRPLVQEVTLMRTYRTSDGLSEPERAKDAEGNEVPVLKLSAENLSAANTWNETIKDLPKYIKVKTSADGVTPEVYESKEIIYLWQEVVPTGYTATGTYNASSATAVEGDGTKTILVDNNSTLTNTATIGEVTVTKTWDDVNDKDGLRNAAINEYKANLTLFANNTKVVDGTEGITKSTFTTTDNETTVTWSGLPVYDASGNEITYSVEEGIINNYTLQSGTYTTTITKNASDNTWKGTISLENKHVPGTVNFKFTKAWSDSNNSNGKRPTVAEFKEWITLWRESTNVDKEDVTNNYADSLTVIANDDGTYTLQWTELDRYDAQNVDYTYTAKETIPSSGNGSYYQGSVSARDSASGTATVANAGESVEVKNNGTVTNKLIYKDITVSKIWVDKVNEHSDPNNSTDSALYSGIRPTSIDISLRKAGETTDIEGTRKTINASTTLAGGSYNGETFKYTYEKLPVYEADGTTVIDYDVYEYKVPNYTTSYIQALDTVVNTYKMTKFTATKVWNDGGMKRDNAAELNGKLTLMRYTTDSAASTEVAKLNSNSVHVDWNGNTFTVRGLPAQDENGNAYTYWVKEDTLSDYDAPVYGGSVHGNDLGVLNTGTITNNLKTTEVTVTKIWDDIDYGNHGTSDHTKRPESITFQLYKKVGSANPVAVSGKTITLTEANKDASDANKWVGTITGVPVTENGQAITYSFVENNVPEGYVVSYSDDGKTITNSYRTYGTIEGRKIWLDGENADNTRTDITMKLYANGEAAKDINGEPVDDIVLVNDINQPMEFVWTNLPTHDEDGNVIRYTIEEVGADSRYETRIEYPDGDGTDEFIALEYNEGNLPYYDEVTVTNELKDTVTIEGDKTWVDNEDFTGTHDNANEITLHVLRDGNEITSDDAGNELTVVWTDNHYVIMAIDGDDTSATYGEVIDATLNKYWWKEETTGGNTKYSSGKYEYTVQEDALENYTTKYDGLNITNTFKQKLDAINVTKVWNDGNNAEGIRPKSVTVHLYTKDGTSLIQVAEEKKVINNGAEETGVTWSDLPVYNADGTKIEYVVEEETVAGYVTTYSVNSVELDGETGADSVVVTNTLTPATNTVTVTKEWQDENNKDNIRPESVTVDLYEYVWNKEQNKYVKNETALSSKTLNEANSWSDTWTNLAMTKKGKTVIYTVQERDNDNLSRYEEAIVTGNQVDGFTVINKHASERVYVKVTKVWDDADVYGKENYQRIPVTITLTGKVGDTEVDLNGDADGTTLSTTIPADASGEQLTVWFKDLPLKQGDDVITYTVSETGEGLDKWTVSGGTLTAITEHEYQSSSVIEGYEATFTNKPKEAEPEKETLTLDIVKKDSLGDGVLEGAIFTVTKRGATSGTDTSPTDSEGKTSYEISEPGIYYVTEKTAPSGYSINNTRFEFEVTEELDEIRFVNNNGWTSFWNRIFSNSENNEAFVIDDSTTPKTYTLTVKNASEKGNIIVKKVWDDNDNQDKLRKTSIEFTISATVDGDPVDVVEDLGLSSNKMTMTGIDTTVADEAEAGTMTWSNLPAYYNNKPITYTIEETGTNVISNYTPSYDGNGVTLVGNEAVEDKTITVTNTNTPATTKLKVAKAWSDNENQDGKRPTEITVKLYKEVGLSRTLVETVTVKANEEWTYEWPSLPAYDNGKAIKYYVVEDAVADYTKSGDGVANGKVTVVDNAKVDDLGTITITNTHTPETTKVAAKKVWDDGNNQDNTRKATTVTLYKSVDGGTAEAVTGQEAKDITTEGNTVEWTNLPVYENGKKITYSVVEASVEGYTTAYSDALVAEKTDSGTITITNTYTPITGYVKVTKTWDDKDNAYGERTNEIKVHLYKTVNGVTRHVETLQGDEVVTNAEHYEVVFGPLPAYENGQLITYTVTEEKIDGYKTTIGSGVTITRNNSTEATAATIGITNTHPEEVTIVFTKTWDDDSNRDGVRPSVSEFESHIKLLADGTDITRSSANKLSAVDNDDNTYSLTWSRLAKKNSNEEDIVYTIQETAISNYTIETANPVTVNEDGTAGITNKHIVGTKSITGTKVWLDPTDTPVTTHTNEEEVTLEVHRVLGSEDVTLTKDTDYTVSWSGDTYTVSGVNGNMPAYKDGQEYTYYVVEQEVDGYTTSYSGEDNTKAYDGETITNRNKVLDDVIEVEVTKEWLGDEGVSEETRSDIEITLYKTIDGATSAVDTKTISKDATDEDLTVTFTNLDKYDKNNTRKTITYTIDETAIPEGYSKVVSGPTRDESGTTPKDVWTVTNTYDNGKTHLVVSKVWDDNDNQDGKRPESVTIYLYADGTEVEGTTLELNEANNWKDAFTGLDLRNETTGEDIVYTISEEEVSEYTASEPVYDRENRTATITNSLTPGVVTIKATKVWDTASEEAKAVGTTYRKDVVLHLYGKQEEKIGYIADPVIISKDATTEEELTATWSDLPQYVDGKELKWEVYEEFIPGYASNVVDNGDNTFTVTNTYVGPQSEIKAIKVWDDSNNQDGIRPEKAVFELWQIIGEEVSTIVDGSERDVTGEESEPITWSNLPVSQTKEETVETPTGNYVHNETGDVIDQTAYEAITDEEEKAKYEEEKITETITKEEGIVYFVQEQPIDGYEANVTVNSDGIYEVHNIHVPEKKDIIITKNWADSNNNRSKRPEAIKVTLSGSDGSSRESYVGGDMTSETWTYTFTNLDVYMNEGTAIEYTVSEDEVAGYTTEINGYEITNTLIDEFADIKVTKVWNDNENARGIRPATINVNLAGSDGNSYDAVLGIDDVWEYVFEDLPTYDASGALVEYTLSEEPVACYTTGITKNGNEFIVANTIQNTINVKATKVWDHKDNPSPVTTTTFTLTANGEAIDTKDINAETTTVEWNDLAVLDEQGNPIVYNIVEAEVPQYVMSMTQDTTIEASVETHAFVITNVYSDDIYPAVTYIDPLAEASEMIKKTTLYGTSTEATSEANTKAESPEAPSHEGYEFVGWDVDFDPVSGYVLVAKYKEKNVTVTYVDPLASTALVSTVVTTDPSSVARPSDPSHDKYTFLRWIEISDAAGNITYVAAYEAIPEECPACPVPEECEKCDACDVTPAPVVTPTPTPEPKKIIPDTSDNAHTVGYGILFGSSILAIIMNLLARRRFE